MPFAQNLRYASLPCFLYPTALVRVALLLKAAFSTLFIMRITVYVKLHTSSACVATYPAVYPSPGNLENTLSASNSGSAPLNPLGKVAGPKFRSDGAEGRVT